MKCKAKPKICVDPSEWKRVYAWLPVKTIDNQWIWLEDVFEREIVGKFDIYREYKEAYKL
jgi:hypothetical protein